MAAPVVAIGLVVGSGIGPFGPQNKAGKKGEMPAARDGGKERLASVFDPGSDSLSLFSRGVNDAERPAGSHGVVFSSRKEHAGEIWREVERDAAGWEEIPLAGDGGCRVYRDKGKIRVVLVDERADGSGLAVYETGRERP